MEKIAAIYDIFFAHYSYIFIYVVIMNIYMTYMAMHRVRYETLFTQYSYIFIYVLIMRIYMTYKAIKIANHEISHRLCTCTNEHMSRDTYENFFVHCSDSFIRIMF